jgi:hypothetical protein
MTQCQLEQLVAGATGEDLHEIEDRGFNLADPEEVNFDPEPDNLPPQMIDWDEADQQRYAPTSFEPRECCAAA